MFLSMFEKWQNLVQTMPITMDIAHPLPEARCATGSTQKCCLLGVAVIMMVTQNLEYVRKQNWPENVPPLTSQYFT